MDWKENWYTRMLRRMIVAGGTAGVAGMIAYLTELAPVDPQQVAVVAILTSLLMALDKALRDHTSQTD